MERHRIRAVALLLLVKDGKICLGKRQNTEAMDGYYAVPAGHIEAGESAVQGMIREAKEETGIDINPSDLRCVLTSYRRMSSVNGDAVDFFFLCEKWNGALINAEPDKCTGWDFYDLDDLPSLMVPSQVDAIAAWRAGKTFLDVCF